jgi:hypothetical protein
MDRGRALAGKGAGLYMPGKNKEQSGKYLYAIMAGSEERHYGPLGIEGGDVYTVPAGGMAAVVSDLREGRIRPERRNLAAHRDVINRAMLDSTVLPISFGVIGDSRQAIQNILSRNREALAAQLRRLTGKAEMGLHVTWDVPNIFEYFILTHPDLRAARDRIMSARGEPAHEEKLELGHLFERILNEDREALTAKVEQCLGAHCSEFKLNPCRDVKEVVNLACLINRKDQGAFQAGVLHAASFFDDNYSFDYNGPWAPHNFVDIDLNL